MIIRPEGSDVGVWVDDPPLTAEELAERAKIDRERAEQKAARAEFDQRRAAEAAASAARIAVYKALCEASEENLKPLLNDDFLKTLVQAACKYGEANTNDFVEWCFAVANKELPEDCEYDDPWGDY